MNDKHQQIWNIAIFQDKKNECIHVMPHPNKKRLKELIEILEFTLKELKNDYG